MRSVRGLVFALLLALLGLLAPAGVSGQEPPLSTEEGAGIGRAATAAEIRAWDIDIMPDGTGLPPGRGTVAAGAAVFATKCAFCHGEAGQGGLPATGEVLVGTQPWFELGNPRLLGSRTIGNYWPYATTLYDYINRAMPFPEPGSLTPTEVYSVTAWLLWMNEIIPENLVLDQRTLPAVRMPALDFFVPDPRTESL